VRTILFLFHSTHGITRPLLDVGATVYCVGANSACAKRATQPGNPPPVVTDPETLGAQAAYPFGHSAIAWSRPRLLRVFLLMAAASESESESESS
jgi:hypothetical protein